MKSPQKYSELIEYLREDLATHDGDWHSCGFRSLAVHRLGVYLNNSSSGFLKRVAMRVYMALFRYTKNRYGIEILYTVKIGRRVKFNHQHGIVVNQNSTIGDDCSILHCVTLGANPKDNFIHAPTLENNVFVSPGAKIVGDITIGENSRILPNAVVMESIPANSIVTSHAISVTQRSKPHNNNGE